MQKRRINVKKSKPFKLYGKTVVRKAHQRNIKTKKKPIPQWKKKVIQKEKDKKEVGWIEDEEQGVYYYASEEEIDKYCDETLLPFPIIVEIEDGYAYYDTGSEQPTGVVSTLDEAQELISLHRDI